jgi:hypothetical protein
MLVKIHNSCRIIAAICDKELFGKKFEEGDKQLDLTTTFFKGEEKTEKEVCEIIEDMIREDATFNIVGKKACRIAKKVGIIDDNSILFIDDVPVGLVLL